MPKWECYLKVIGNRNSYSTSASISLAFWNPLLPHLSPASTPSSLDIHSCYYAFPDMLYYVSWNDQTINTSCLKWLLRGILALQQKKQLIEKHDFFFSFKSCLWCHKHLYLLLVFLEYVLWSGSAQDLTLSVQHDMLLTLGELYCLEFSK